jgi:DNA polymerase III subunit delta'
VLSDVVGQDEAVHCLRRVVEGKLRSPLLLIGDEGTGRRFSVNQAFAEIAVARRGEKCPDLKQLDQGMHPDMTFVTAPSDKEIGVDPIREALAKAGNLPASMPYRFFVIDGADRMTPAAANAILKTVEELPSYARFFLLAESYDRVIPTIRSRCGRVNFRKLPESFIISKISSFEKDPDRALVYARLGEGSVGRAVRYLGSNRLAMRNSVFNALQLSVQGDLPSAFSALDDLAKELPLALRFLVFLVHDVFVCALDPPRVINQDIAEDLLSMRSRMKDDVLHRLWDSLRTVWERYESSYVNLGFQMKTALALTFCGV